jgi:hypothetical protein
MEQPEAILIISFLALVLTRNPPISVQIWKPFGNCTGATRGDLSKFNYDMLHSVYNGIVTKHNDVTYWRLATGWKTEGPEF